MISQRGKEELISVPSTKSIVIALLVDEELLVPKIRSG